MSLPLQRVAPSRTWVAPTLAAAASGACSRAQQDGMGEGLVDALLFVGALGCIAFFSLGALVVGLGTTLRNARGDGTRRSYRWGLGVGIYNGCVGLLALCVSAPPVLRAGTLTDLGVLGLACLVFGLGCWGMRVALQNPHREDA